MFRFLYAVQLDKPTASCQNCGHAIAQCFYIEHTETKVRMVVGCECVVHLLAKESVADFERNRKRMNRAAAQWRKKEPKPLENETRTEYINRRICEMGNALKAHRDWVAFNRQQPLYNRIYADLCKEYGDPYYFLRMRVCSELWVDRQRTAIFDWFNAESNIRCQQITAEFAKQHQANPYDFNQASWNVRKI